MPGRLGRIGPQGRLILKVAADKINTPRRLGRR
jgi:hypothetical protein